MCPVFDQQQYQFLGIELDRGKKGYTAVIRSVADKLAVKGYHLRSGVGIFKHGSPVNEGP